MALTNWPLISALADCQSVLLAGAGGGFDIYSGIPLYVSLKEADKDVHLANLSFASLPRDKALRLTAKCVQVSADTPLANTYFPERHLATWLREERNEEATVYAFPLTGVVPLRAAYRKLVQQLNLDAIILIDGGTDSLMRGDEVGLGTPEEDLTSLAAVAGVDIPHTYLASIGFGIDTFHGVCHAQFLEAVADLTRANAFLGVSSVLPGTPEANALLSAVDHANANTPRRESIVANSIASAVQRYFGDLHRTKRTEGSRLWINPLMALYWAFELDAVAERHLFLEELEGTESLADVTAVISRNRGRIEPRSWQEMPV